MDFAKLLSSLKNINTQHLPAQLSVLTGPQQLFLMLVLIFIFLYGISVGKTRATLSLLAIYVAYMLTTTFPFLAQVSQWAGKVDPYMVHLGIFLATYIGGFILLSTSSLKNRLSLGEISLAKVFLVSMFQIGFLASILASMIPAGVVPKSLIVAYPYLGTQQALFFWAVASLIILPFIKGNSRRE